MRESSSKAEGNQPKERKGSEEDAEIKQGGNKTLRNPSGDHLVKDGGRSVKVLSKGV